MLINTDNYSLFTPGKAKDLAEHLAKDSDGWSFKVVNLGAFCFIECFDEEGFYTGRL